MTTVDPRAAAQQWLARWAPIEPNPADGPDAEPYGLNPLIAYILYSVLTYMGDDWPEELGGELTRTCLPKNLAVWLLDDDFTAAMAASCFHLADRLEAGPGEARFTRCTADEVNLAIAHKLSTITHEELLADDPVVDVLHEMLGRLDFELELDTARELLADDTDVDFLWNPALDGIENDTDLQQSFRIVNLHPRDWFKSFND
jgi:hypothetical protein